MTRMEYQTFRLETMPALAAPMFIIGFRGWGNALEVSAGTAAYLVETLQAVPFGHMEPDACYRYDENRPVVKIETGVMKSITPPGGSFFAIQTHAGENDLVVLVADEPSLNWYHFSRELVDLAHRLKAPGVITLGSMFDNVLHTDRVISAVTTGSDVEGQVSRQGVIPINYHGPSAIHTIILEACRKRAVSGASLWGHCPTYLQGITHHGMMLQLVRLLADMASFSVKTDALEAGWEALKTQIQKLMTDNPKLQEIMNQVRKKKREGAMQDLGQNGNEQGKVINLKDFLDP
ncbi:PAC2 family protein [Desulfosarcina sp.]|uniref:PAC2 family protein n=1 Tax=Desulfosarcina sp. TaxID=2027861 RepID=UPI00356158FA